MKTPWFTIISVGFGIAAIILFAVQIILAWLNGTWNITIHYNDLNEGYLELILIVVSTPKVIHILWTKMWEV